MVAFSKIRVFLIYFLIIALVAPSIGCYKPGYLQKSQSTAVSERWKVEGIDASSLSADEKKVFETLGAPTYIRFFRKLSPEREGVYEWVYTDPVRMVYFVDGQQLEYVVMDEDLSRLTYHEKKWRLYGSITAAVVGGVGLLTYYLIGRK